MNTTHTQRNRHEIFQYSGNVPIVLKGCRISDRTNFDITEIQKCEMKRLASENSEKPSKVSGPQIPIFWFSSQLLTSVRKP